MLGVVLSVVILTTNAEALPEPKVAIHDVSIPPMPLSLIAKPCSSSTLDSYAELFSS